MITVAPTVDVPTDPSAAVRTERGQTPSVQVGLGARGGSVAILMGSLVKKRRKRMRKKKHKKMLRRTRHQRRK